MKEKILRHHLDKCVDYTQEHVDLESARAISSFGVDTNANYEWLYELNSRYPTRKIEEIRTYQLLKTDYMKKLDNLDGRITYFENLAKELDEFQNEVNIKMQRIKRSTYNDD
ncbi:Bli1p Ecym_4575 [Eremothecium cymbalariae DBVPG|uniref:Biogenesis of lysosome-related organelles complex 1 subunit BLI1 n=1 Tax=Eremothecium cymbalariae (strain CBS 270.75 / DBVPG 7215 / KCTC 17166 / NRRL Y-17582) TaxID=931890 RepID=G8JS86_ERECY|nr:hypothetical protein Ecym_4575 [Eremothecium cymbalariae DBVPG\